jgi:hypothetical protein
MLGKQCCSSDFGHGSEFKLLMNPDQALIAADQNVNSCLLFSSDAGEARSQLYPDRARQSTHPALQEAPGRIRVTSPCLHHSGPSYLLGYGTYPVLWVS